MQLRSLLAFPLLLLSLSAHGYYSVLDTGEIMPAGRYKLTPELQFLSAPGGANVGAHFDYGLSEDTALRAEFGFGTIDFYGAGYFKYMPYPDIDNQPAIGFNAGLTYASDTGYSELTVRLEPLVSKKFNVDFGAITPYASLPIGIQRRAGSKYASDRNNLAMQLAFGTQVDLKTVENVGLMVEVGIDLNKAHSYVSFGGAWYFGNEGAK